MDIITKSNSKKVHVGTASFLYCFYSTLMCQLNGLEDYSAVKKFLKSGAVDGEFVKRCANELVTIREALSHLAPDQIIWNMDDRSAAPPWGQDISSEITSLGNYFVTSDGKDLFEELIELLNHASDEKESVVIQ